MPVFLLYLLQSSVCLLAFYLLYLGVLRRLTFFTWSRFYLVTALLISVLIPRLRIALPAGVEQPPAIMAPLQEVPVVMAKEGVENEVVMAAADKEMPGISYWWLVYITGVAVMAARLGVSLFRLWQMLRRNERVYVDGCVVVLTTGVNASFFHYIFVDRKAFAGDDRAHILLHEQTHVRLRHSADLMLLELVSVICWFNPVMWWYKRSMKEVHEFQADRAVAEETNVKTYAGVLLRLATAGRSIPVNTFSKQPLKGRISMLFTNPSHKMKKLLFMLVVPVAGVLLYSFSSVSTPAVTPSKTGGKPFVIVLDAGHGGTDAGASSASKHEKDLTLLLTQEIGAQAKAAGFEILFTRSGDETLTPQDRIAALQDRQADLFLSIHINASAKAGPSGSEIFLAKNAQWFPASKKVASIMYQQLKDVSGLPVTAPPTVREKDIYVLQNAKSAAMLLSVGYLNNPGDVKLLENETWRKAYAAKVIQGLQYFRENVYVGTYKSMHEKMGLPEQATHIWQLDRRIDTTVKRGGNGDGC